MITCGRILTLWTSCLSKKILGFDNPQPEIEKDQTYVQQFESVEMEVAAHLQIVVVEDNLLDEMVNTPNNMGEKEKPSATHLEKTFETSDSSKEEKRPNYLGSNINNFENYNPVSG